MHRKSAERELFENTKLPTTYAQPIVNYEPAPQAVIKAFMACFALRKKETTARTKKNGASLST